MGRLAWLMKIKGRFLEDALEFSVASTNLESLPGESKYSNHSSVLHFQLSTDEQLKSACEIADTDGDGILTYQEAIEVADVVVEN